VLWQPFNPNASFGFICAMTQSKLPETTKSGLAPVKAFEFTAQQLDHEVERSAARIARFLTFSGLLLASLAIAARAPEADPLRVLLMRITPMAGLAAAVATYLGVGAAQSARDRIKAYWRDTGLEDHFPPLYSPQKSSRKGRWASKGLIIIIGIVWVVIWIGTLTNAQL